MLFAAAAEWRLGFAGERKPLEELAPPPALLELYEPALLKFYRPALLESYKSDLREFDELARLLRKTTDNAESLAAISEKLMNAADVLLKRAEAHNARRSKMLTLRFRKRTRSYWRG